MLDSYPLIKRLSSFASVGATVTLLSMATNFIALKYFETHLVKTYTVIYVSSIFLSFVLNSHFTFKSAFSLGNLAKYILVYLLAMLFGILLLRIYSSLLDFENWVYPFMVIPFTVCINFFMANRFLRKRTV